MKPPIPKSALEHHIAFVGKTGSGKTASAKSGIIEPALAADERVCVIDPTGAWWGLRLAADGKSPGFPIYVFGGDHGDFPLLPGQGEMIAAAIGETSAPVIRDTTRLKTGERMRFFTDFAIDALARAYPAAMSREDLAAEINLAVSGGTFSTYVSRLRSPGLIEVSGQEIRCSASLMGDLR